MDMQHQFKKLDGLSRGLDLAFDPLGDRFSRWQIVIEALADLICEIEQNAEIARSYVEYQLKDVTQPPVAKNFTCRPI